MSAESTDLAGNTKSDRAKVAASSSGGMVKTAVAGALMGIANLIPGVSGGTMILAMGLYDEFIASVADVSSFRFSRARIRFLVIVGAAAALAIAGLAPAILYLLFRFDVAMYALFIGLTLGGAPMLVRSVRPLTPGAVVGAAAGLAVMGWLAFARGDVSLPRNSLFDFVSGFIASVTMVLPGISGSYVLLILGQYERIVGSIRNWREPDLSIIVPVGVGVVAGIVLLSNALKYMLRRFKGPTLGLLLGLLLGSVLGLWPFGRTLSEEALQARSLGEIADVAARKGIALQPGADKDAAIEQISRQWSRRDRGLDYSPPIVLCAIVLCGLGFWATASLSGRKGGAGLGDS